MGFDVQETLQQMLQQLDICQKALSNFLEDKRSAFPRFYFIGDDDLLEVSKSPSCNLTICQVWYNMVSLFCLLQQWPPEAPLTQCFGT